MDNEDSDRLAQVEWLLKDKTRVRVESESVCAELARRVRVSHDDVDTISNEESESCNPEGVSVVAPTNPDTIAASSLELWIRFGRSDGRLSSVRVVSDARLVEVRLENGPVGGDGGGIGAGRAQYLGTGRRPREVSGGQVSEVGVHDIHSVPPALGAHVVVKLFPSTRDAQSIRVVFISLASLGTVSRTQDVASNPNSPDLRALLGAKIAGLARPSRATRDDTTPTVSVDERANAVDGHAAARVETPPTPGKTQTAAQCEAAKVEDRLSSVVARVERLEQLVLRSNERQLELLERLSAKVEALTSEVSNLRTIAGSHTVGP